MLRRLYVDNFRCFSDFEFTPGKQAVLVGPNGSGKSSLFDLIAMLRDFLVGGLPAKDLFLARTRTLWKSEPVQRIELDVDGPDGSRYHYVLAVTQDLPWAGVTGCQEELWLGEQCLYRTANGEVQLYADQVSSAPLAKFPFDRQRSFLPVMEARPDNRLITGFKEWLQRMFLFRLRPDQVERITQQETRGLLREGTNFVSWYRVLQQEDPQITEQVRGDLRPVLGGLASMRLVPVGPEAKALMFGHQRPGEAQDYELAFHELSDGQRALVMLYAILRKFAPQASLLVLDEPDNYITQSEIQPWLSLLRETLDEANSTLLVISHHPEVIDYLAPEQVLYFEREAGGPATVRKLDIALEPGLSASQWIQAGVDGE